MIDLYICDLGVNETDIEDFVKELKRIKSEGTSIIYIDHHEVSEDLIKQFYYLVDGYFHSDECASIQTYNYFLNMDSSKDSAQVRTLACCGAIMDYLDNKPVAASYIDSMSRPFLMLEATLLGFTINTYTTNYDKQVLINKLVNGTYSHDIGGATTYARYEAQQYVKLIKVLTRSNIMGVNRQTGQTSDTFAYYIVLDDEDFDCSSVASMLRYTCEVPIGVAFKADGDIYKISLRATQGSKYNLAEIMKRMTRRIRGVTGGGHPKAAGGSVPIDKLFDFMTVLEEELR